jgi:hypothetical protein
VSLASRKACKSSSAIGLSRMRTVNARHDAQTS